MAASRFRSASSITPPSRSLYRRPISGAPACSAMVRAVSASRSRSLNLCSLRDFSLFTSAARTACFSLSSSTSFASSTEPVADFNASMKDLRAFSSSSNSFVPLAVVLFSSSVSSASSAVPAPLSQSLGVYKASGLACLALDSFIVFVGFEFAVDNLAIWSDVMTPPDKGDGCGVLFWKSLGTRIMLPPTSIESISFPIPSPLTPT
mmetsp:Transcript_7870/g.16891  ORF Transcript_7870/g.16891 Transcript_7870/m.16891 type:complete len:206 (-) Transcript_7870:695-1312(-)